MKKLLVSVLAFSGLVFPLLAQVDHDFQITDEVPIESLTLKKEQVPAAIVNAVTTDFTKGQAMTWGKFPYTLQNYGWIINKDVAGEKPDHFEAFIKTADGGDVYAIYAPDGKILQSRSLFKNIALPDPVKIALAKSTYKDWNVIGDKEIIKYYDNKKNVEEHFRINVQKNNEKRSISFNYKEPASK